MIFSKRFFFSDGSEWKQFELARRHERLAGSYMSNWSSNVCSSSRGIIFTTLFLLDSSSRHTGILRRSTGIKTSEHASVHMAESGGIRADTEGLGHVADRTNAAPSVLSRPGQIVGKYFDKFLSQFGAFWWQGCDFWWVVPQKDAKGNDRLDWRQSRDRLYYNLID